MINGMLMDKKKNEKGPRKILYPAKTFRISNEVLSQLELWKKELFSGYLTWNQFFETLIKKHKKNKL
jgi:hypothetical protein